jgi:hypothetical protein
MNKFNQTRITANFFQSFVYFHPSSEAEGINEYTEGCRLVSPCRNALVWHETDFLYQQEIPKFFPASCALQIPGFIEFGQKSYLNKDTVTVVEQARAPHLQNTLCSFNKSNTQAAVYL